MPVKLKPSVVSRLSVQVVLRASMSTVPLATTSKRSLAVVGVYSTFDGSLKIAAATALQ